MKIGDWIYEHQGCSKPKCDPSCGDHFIVLFGQISKVEEEWIWYKPVFNGILWNIDCPMYKWEFEKSLVHSKRLEECRKVNEIMRQ